MRIRADEIERFDTEPKPPRQHLPEGALTGFADGDRVPVVWPDFSQSPEACLIDSLIEAGCQIPDHAKASKVIGQAFDTVGIVRASEALRVILSRLPGGRRGQELKQALLGTLGEGVDTASRFNVSKQSWLKTVKRLRDRVFAPTPKNG